MCLSGLYRGGRSNGMLCCTPLFHSLPHACPAASPRLAHGSVRVPPGQPLNRYAVTKGMRMSSLLNGSFDRSVANSVAAGARTRLVPALMAVAIGLILIYASAFAEMPAMHDAAHDGRHSAGFPCH